MDGRCESVWQRLKTCGQWCSLRSLARTLVALRPFYNVEQRLRARRRENLRPVAVHDFLDAAQNSHVADKVRDEPADGLLAFCESIV
jgi:hypothetical protein